MQIRNLSAQHMDSWLLRVKNYYRLKYATFDRKDYKEWVAECNMVSVKFVNSFKSATYNGEPICSFLQINHHTQSFHWVATILFNGPPLHQSTQRYEHNHQPLKSFAGQSNGKNVFLSVMNAVCVTPFPPK